MSHVWELEATALGQIAVAALLLGAGLPALFALGIRASAHGRGGDAEVGGTDAAPHPVGRALSVAIFALVVVIALTGLSVIVASGFGKELSFADVYPTFVDK